MTQPDPDTPEQADAPSAIDGSAASRNTLSQAGSADGALLVDIGGRPLWLCPERAAFDPITHTLLIADAHFGKAETFRAHGIPVPDGTTTDNLQRLDRLIARHAPTRIVFLGDLLHAAPAQAAALVHALAQWRARHATIDIVLIRGNHDLHAGPPAAQWHIDTVDEPWQLGTWTLCHHPVTIAGAYVLAGHEHPTFQLRSATDALRLPCFSFTETLGVLPAFGDFTGGHPTPLRGKRIYVLSDTHVIPVSAPHAQGLTSRYLRGRHRHHT